MDVFELYRGFVVGDLIEIKRKGLNIENPHQKGFRGESNWPRLGLSYGLMDFFNYAQGLAIQFPGKVPVGSKISINEEILGRMAIWGIRRDDYGGIDYWQCHSMKDIYRGWEFIIGRSFLSPKWVEKLNAEICLSEGEYKPYNEVIASIEVRKSWWQRLKKK